LISDIPKYVGVVLCNLFILVRTSIIKYSEESRIKYIGIFAPY